MSIRQIFFDQTPDAVFIFGMHPTDIGEALEESILAFGIQTAVTDYLGGYAVKGKLPSPHRAKELLIAYSLHARPKVLRTHADQATNLFHQSLIKHHLDAKFYAPLQFLPVPLQTDHQRTHAIARYVGYYVGRERPARTFIDFQCASNAIGVGRMDSSGADWIDPGQTFIAPRQAMFGQLFRHLFPNDRIGSRCFAQSIEEMLEIVSSPTADHRDFAMGSDIVAGFIGQSDEVPY